MRKPKSFPLLQTLKRYAFVTAITLASTCVISCGNEDEPEPTPDQVPPDLTIDIAGVPVKMIFVEGGTFQMGATPEQLLSGQKIDDHEYPVHEVTLSSFYIAEFQITNELWYSVYGQEYTGQEPEHPANGSWQDFDDFIRKLNTLTGMNFRMPTEAEWEYAARGGNKSRGYIYPGSNIHDEVAWSYRNSGDKFLAEYDWNWWTMRNNHCGTHRVGMLKANELGLYDMGGNLCEWCSDLYGKYPREPQVNPKGAAEGTTSEHISRGGSYAHFSNASRCSHRWGNPASEEIYWGGRLAMDAR